MFEIVHEAKLLPHELARLLNVSRISTSLWLNGHRKPHRILADRVEALLDRIRVAVENDDLPLSPDIKRQARAKCIDDILA